MSEHHGGYMRLALEQAAKAGRMGNRAVGAIIVRNGVVVGQGGNRRETSNDPTAHAEMMALRDAAANIGSLDFSDCTLYTTLEPCPMCCGAIAVNGVSSVVVGQVPGPMERRWGSYAMEQVLDMVGRTSKVEKGILEPECIGALQEWDVKNGRVTAA